MTGQIHSMLASLMPAVIAVTCYPLVQRMTQGSEFRRSILFGAVCAIASIVSMHINYRYGSTDLIFDARSIPIIMSGMFAGPVGVALCTVFAVLGRL